MEKEKRLNVRILILLTVIVFALAVMFFGSGYCEYLFDYEGYVRSFNPKNYVLTDFSLAVGKSKEDADFTVSFDYAEVKDGMLEVCFTLKSKAGYTEGKLLRTRSLRKKTGEYSAEIMLESGEALSLKSERLSGRTASYVYCLNGFDGLPSETVIIFKKLVVNEYARV